MCSFRYFSSQKRSNGRLMPTTKSNEYGFPSVINRASSVSTNEGMRERKTYFAFSFSFDDLLQEGQVCHPDGDLM